MATAATILLPQGEVGAALEVQNIDSQFVGGGQNNLLAWRQDVLGMRALAQQRLQRTASAVNRLVQPIGRTV